ncbi:MAG: hypothetical protein JOZ31_03325 [Verrucomicrobia bacterium]|nr:hypothetical protein [Verrucomicrobiota bacterium]MBV8484781.1 hypothetical protein [Verrucomicrobiota bacterium]
MDESKPAVNKKTKRGPSPLLLIALISLVLGSAVSVASLIVLAQPVTEDNLWTLFAIPFLIGGGCVTFVGVVVLIVNGALRGTAEAEEVRSEK